MFGWMVVLPLAAMLPSLGLLWQIRLERGWRDAALERAAKWEKMAREWEGACGSVGEALESQKELSSALEKKCEALESLVGSLQALADERAKMIKLLAECKERQA